MPDLGVKVDYTLAEIVGKRAAAAGRAHAKELVRRIWHEVFSQLEPVIEIDGVALSTQEAWFVRQSCERAHERGDTSPHLSAVVVSLLHFGDGTGVSRSEAEAIEAKRRLAASP